MLKGITATGATGSQLMVSGVMFGISALLTIAFVALMFADPGRLAAAWQSVRGLPIVVQVVMWLLLLPWMAALWVFNTGLALVARVGIVLGIMAVAEYLLFPWKG